MRLIAGVGRVDLALTGQSAAGTVYRLRSATLVVDDSGPGAPLVYQTEDDPTRTVISDELDAGAYSLGLEPGWRLERVADDGSATTVAATMLSANPQLFSIAADATIRVALRFRAEGGDVELGRGDLDVVLEVEDPPAVRVVTSVPTVALREGTSAVITVALSGPPSSSVAVAVTGHHPSVRVVPPALFFSAASWNVAQAVEIIALDDGDTDDVATTVTAASPGLGYATIAVTVDDDDTAGSTVIGWLRPASQLEPAPPGRVVAAFVEVPPPGLHVEAYAAFGDGPGPAHIGLYMDAGGRPGPLFGPPSLAFGFASPFEPAFVPTSAPFFVPPGAYWLAYIAEGPGDLGFDPAAPAVPRCEGFILAGGVPPFLELPACGFGPPPTIAALGTF